MTRFGKNIRNMLIYSDSELLELSVCIVMLFINPITQTMHFIHPIWHLMGIFSALLLFIGLGKRNLKTREIALLWGLVNFTAINVTELRHDCIEPNYLFQNFVVGFLWWKVSKQRLVYQIRNGDHRGNH